MICPVDCPYAMVLDSKIILPAIYRPFTMPLLTFSKGIHIHLLGIISIIWIVRSVYLLLRYASQSFRFYKVNSITSATQNIQLISCINEIKKEKGLDIEVKIIQSSAIVIPMVTGFFKPTIYLPSLSFSDSELKLILQHELTHYLHKDSWIKMFMCLIVCIFWWNPFVHILKRDLNHILEIRCDLSLVIQMNEEERIKYLKIILRIAEAFRRTTCPLIPADDATGLLEANKQTKLEQRFYLVLRYEKRKRRHVVLSTLLGGLVALSIIASYMFIIQPSYSIEQYRKENASTITLENPKLMINENSTYALYSNSNIE